MFNIDPPERTFEDNVRYLIDRMALECSTERTLEKMAEILEVHPTTISYWRSKGDVPPWRARWLETRFGRDLAPCEKLSKEIASKLAAPSV